VGFGVGFLSYRRERAWTLFIVSEGFEAASAFLLSLFFSFFWAAFFLIRCFLAVDFLTLTFGFLAAGFFAVCVFEGGFSSFVLACRIEVVTLRGRGFGNGRKT
jgi:hypothetical protein